MKSIKTRLEEDNSGVTELVKMLPENLDATGEIQWFVRDGSKTPNVPNWHQKERREEIAENKNAFDSPLSHLYEAVNADQYNLAKYRGGVIVFSTDVNAVKQDENAIKDKFKKLLATFKNQFFTSKMLREIIKHFNKYNPDDEAIAGYSIGNYFKGKYLSPDTGEEFTEKSISIEIDGASTPALLGLGEYICRVFKQETVLIKDFNTNKIYFANPVRSKDKPDFSSINANV